jgi:hypothetical protein
MLKPINDLGKPDPRYMPGSPADHVIGQRIEDLHALMQPLELLPSVPDNVLWQFDTARNAFVYSWFCYDLDTLAEMHAYGALENGLRIRAERANAHPKRKGMQAYMDNACDRGWLVKPEWEVPGAPNLLDLVVMMRNNIGHGRPQLLQPLSIEGIRLSMEILNKLFPATS